MPRKMPTQYAGGQVDETLKARTVKMLVGLPLRDEMISQLKIILGRYRSLKRSRDTEPSKAEEIGHTEKTLQLITELQEHLNQTPESIKAQIGLYEWRLSREIESQAFGRLHRELNDLRVFAGRAVSDAKQWNTKTGERPKHEERDLLSQVSSLIEFRGLKKIDSADLALQILRSEEGAIVPADPEKAREAILAARKRLPP
jgi:hypothetical protein